MRFYQPCEKRAQLEFIYATAHLHRTIGSYAKFQPGIHSELPVPPSRSDLSSSREIGATRELARQLSQILGASFVDNLDRHRQVADGPGLDNECPSEYPWLAVPVAGGRDDSCESCIGDRHDGPKASRTDVLHRSLQGVGCIDR